MYNMSSPMRQTLNGLVYGFWAGKILLTPIALGPAFVYELTDSPQFLSDTLIIDIEGDIDLFGGNYACTLPHILPSPVRKYDFEAHISINTVSCLFYELANPEACPLMCPVISKMLFDPSIALTFGFPFANLTFVPKTNSLSLSVDAPALNLTVSFMKNTVPIISVSPSILTNVNIFLLPGGVMVNGTAMLSGLSASIATPSLVPSSYLYDIQNENWASLTNQVNTLLQSVTLSKTIQSEYFNQIITQYFNNLAFDATADYVIVRANLNK